MPYPSEHAARVKNPNLFIKESFRSINITTGVRVISGKLVNGTGKMVTQAYRFDKSQFTPSEARKWLVDHGVNYILFEPASR